MARITVKEVQPSELVINGTYLLRVYDRPVSVLHGRMWTKEGWVCDYDSDKPLEFAKRIFEAPRVKHIVEDD